MKVGFLSDSTIEAMSNFLGRLVKRQQIIASNLANIDTPGYRTRDISFHATMEELLAERPALRVTRPEHRPVDTRTFGTREPMVFEVEGLTSRPDRNNVDLDREMLKLGETSSSYNTIVQLLRAKLRIIASSINEGRVGG